MRWVKRIVVSAPKIADIVNRQDRAGSVRSEDWRVKATYCSSTSRSFDDEIVGKTLVISC